MSRALLLAAVTGMWLVAHPAPAHACHQDDDTDDADARDDRDDHDDADNEHDDDQDGTDEVRASADALVRAIEAKIDATLEAKLSRLEHLLDDFEHRRTRRGAPRRPFLSRPPQPPHPSRPPAAPQPPRPPAAPQWSPSADVDIDFDLDFDVGND
jgi:hypothetical protein